MLSKSVFCFNRNHFKNVVSTSVFRRFSSNDVIENVEAVTINVADYPKLVTLGLNEKLVEALVAQNITNPTPVQKAVIPRLLNRENLVMAASTGSGETLAYSLPTIQNLNQQEQDGYLRQPQRPRCLVLVPTRELARQVLQSIKQVGHFSKISSAAVLGGEQYALQKKSLDRLVDIVVASPGRLMQHKEQGNVFFSHVNTIIIDEVDTMLTQGFGSDIRAILRNVINRKPREKTEGGRKVLGASEDAVVKSDEQQVQLIMATATLTKAVRSLLADVEGGFNIEYSDLNNLTPKKLTGDETRIALNIVEVDGVHRILPNVKHHFEDTKGKDKLLTLRSLLEQSKSKKQRTMIFCNTISSCRAVEYAINEEGSANILNDIQTLSSAERQQKGRLYTLSYHGDMNSQQRAENLDLFRTGQVDLLVCTDIAARGIDIPEIDHVVLFDFPMNPVDYLHRAGRCGRAGRKGMVTSILSKRDMVLAEAIQRAIAAGEPIDSLTADKKDYQPTNRMSMMVPRRKSLLGNRIRDGRRDSRGGPDTRRSGPDSRRPSSRGDSRSGPPGRGDSRGDRRSGPPGRGDSRGDRRSGPPGRGDSRGDSRGGRPSFFKARSTSNSYSREGSRDSTGDSRGDIRRDTRGDSKVDTRRDSRGDSRSGSTRGGDTRGDTRSERGERSYDRSSSSRERRPSTSASSDRPRKPSPFFTRSSSSSRGQGSNDRRSSGRR